jgi:tetratricopeptide (TPR) repeat protein
VADTLSLIGGIYLKRKNPKKALEYFKKSEKLQKNKNDRIYNYLAKTSILLGYTNKAKEYLKQAEEFENKKGFSILTNLFLLYKSKTYQDMFEFAKKTIFLPKNRQEYDKVVLGWSYYLLAQKAFEKELYFDGVKYLDKSIFYFIEDKYILEAYFVSVLNIELPQKEKNYFENILNNYEIKDKFEEFVKKHSLIADKYCDIFGINNSHKNNLKKFLDNPQTDKYFLI